MAILIHSTAQFIGMFSQWWMRTRHPRWFTKYKYVIVALFALQNAG